MPVQKSWILPTTIYPPDTICVDLHIPNDPAYIQAFFGAVEQLTKAYNHDDPYNDGSLVAYAWQDVIDNTAERLRTGGSCSVYQLRMSPTIPCQVEQSLDGGETWIDAFNLMDCISNVVTPIVDSQGDWLLRELMDKWDGTAESVTQNLTYDGSGDDVYRDIALCNALELFVDSLCEAEIQKRVNQTEVWEDLAPLIASTAVTIGLLPIPGARFAALGLAYLAIHWASGLAIWAGLSLAILENETFRQQAACVMYDAMNGSTPTFSSFQTSLDNHDFFFLLPVVELINAIKPFIQELEVFVTFLQIWDSVYPMAEGGFIDSCVCPDEGWKVEFLAGAGRPPNWSFPSNAPYSLAKYNSPGDYWYADDTPSQPESSAYATVEFFVAGTFDLDWIMWDINLTSTGSNAFNSGQQEWLYDDVGDPIANHNNPGYHKNNTPATVGWDTTQTGIKTVRLQARIYDPEDDVDTQAILSRITIKGTGTIPPEWVAFEV